MHRWPADPAPLAHDPALYKFFLECKAAWYAIDSRRARKKDRAVHGSGRWNQSGEERGIFRGGEQHGFPDTDVRDLEALYEQLHGRHVDGYMLSPHYPERQLCRDGSARFHLQMHQRFREASERLGDYNLMIPPIYLEYLRGERELNCSVWGGPVYGPHGWAGPGSLLNVGFAESYKALLETTMWELRTRTESALRELPMPSGIWNRGAVRVEPKGGRPVEDDSVAVGWEFGRRAPG